MNKEIYTLIIYTNMWKKEEELTLLENVELKDKEIVRKLNEKFGTNRKIDGVRRKRQRMGLIKTGGRGLTSLTIKIGAGELSLWLES